VKMKRTRVYVTKQHRRATKAIFVCLGKSHKDCVTWKLPSPGVIKTYLSWPVGSLSTPSPGIGEKRVLKLTVRSVDDR
jgi:hypothetical protein